MGERLIQAADAGALERAARLFGGWQETLIWSALEGGMGRIWTVKADPRAALCENADFLFLSGAAGEPETRTLLECWRREREGFCILVPKDPACGVLIEEIFGTSAEREDRFAFHKGGEHFDRERLLGFLAAVPPDVTIVPFDRALYHQALQNDWSRDFCSQFRDADDYLERGLGFAALCGDELIGGASSYTCYSKGIEIQVETRRDHQRRGIASACCAALVLECLKRNLYPSWDAANTESVGLAKKLGYREAGSYPAWEITVHKTSD